MARKYVLDTSLYVRAFRSVEAAAELEHFYTNFTPAIYLSSVVLHELLAGSNSPRKRRDIEEKIARPLNRVARLITPSHAAWEDAGILLSRMSLKEKLDLKRAPKSLVLDLLLASSCKEAGVILITENLKDFGRIRGYTSFEFTEPWPGLRTKGA
jgi:predicted nucleic acid-binding protein